MRPFAAFIITAAVFLPAVACDPSTAAEHVLATEVERLQAENDILRASVHLAVVAPIDAPTVDVVSFREQGVPWQRYIPVVESQGTFVAIMKACAVKNITISTSGYDPDTGSSDDQVLSLQYSYVGDAKARKCLDAEMTKRGAVSI